ncbi:MAG: FAD-dependent oxidoreductase [Candidatus Sumerlaeota bacterium]
MTVFEKTYDVVVAGGGVAGAAAALEAARSGKRVALVEKTVWSGGLATTGLINIYLPLCDGRGRQVSFGIAEEMLHASITYGPGGVKGDWRSGVGPRYRTDFAPGAFVLALDEMLEEAWVDVWYDTLVCLPIMDGRRCAGVEVENKSGRGALQATVTVDATGDADLAYRAGAPCEDGVNNLSVWSHEISLEKLREAADDENLESLLNMARYGLWRRPDEVDGYERFEGIDGKLVSDYMLKGRRLVRNAFQKRAQENPDERHQWLAVCLPAMAQFRRTRRIEGRSTLRPEDMGEDLADSAGLMGDWRKAGPVYALPFGSLLPRGVENLLVAGRCVSAEGDAWEITRVIPSAAMSGQVAGAAASLAIDAKVCPGQVPIDTLQAFLQDERGFALQLEDVGLSADDFKEQESD